MSVKGSGDASNLRVPPEVTKRHGLTKSVVCEPEGGPKSNLRARRSHFSFQPPHTMPPSAARNRVVSSPHRGGGRG